MEIKSRNDLPKFFKEQGYEVGAEIGVYKGEFSERLCRAGLKIYGVDPYITYKNYRKHPKEIDYEEMYLIADNLLNTWGGKLIRKTSMEALADIPDESLDFVYIDGNHSFPYIAQDIYEWSRKVRKGGVVSGHDYFNDSHNPYWIRACHVKHAVDACAKIFNTKLRVIGQGTDKCPSWLWIKE